MSPVFAPQYLLIHGTISSTPLHPSFFSTTVLCLFLGPTKYQHESPSTSRDIHKYQLLVSDVMYLVQRLPRYIDAVDLQDLIVDPQQSRALCQPSTHQPGDEHPGDLGRGHSRSEEISYLTSKWRST